jgi:hypothetical protein
MQDMRSPAETLGERGPSDTILSGQGACPWCGGQVFEIYIFSDGSSGEFCVKTECGKEWPRFRSKRVSAGVYAKVAGRPKERG